MGTTSNITVGDRGRLVIPADVRARLNWDQGTVLILLETEEGAVLASRDQALALLRKQLDRADLVSELIEERRAAARQESA